jgi:hypothetical protein
MLIKAWSQNLGHIIWGTSQESIYFLDKTLQQEFSW